RHSRRHRFRTPSAAREHLPPPSAVLTRAPRCPPPSAVAHRPPPGSIFRDRSRCPRWLPTAFSPPLSVAHGLHGSSPRSVHPPPQAPARPPQPSFVLPGAGPRRAGPLVEDHPRRPPQPGLVLAVLTEVTNPFTSTSSTSDPRNLHETGRLATPAHTAARRRRQATAMGRPRRVPSEAADPGSKLQRPRGELSEMANGPPARDPGTRARVAWWRRPGGRGNGPGTSEPLQPTSYAAAPSGAPVQSRRDEWRDVHAAAQKDASTAPLATVPEPRRKPERPPDGE